MTSLLTGKEEFGDTQAQEETRPCADGGRSWDDTATSQGMPRTSNNHPKPGRVEDGFFPRTFKSSTVLPTPAFQTYILQNCERVNFCSFKSPSLG